MLVELPQQMQAEASAEPDPCPGGQVFIVAFQQNANSAAYRTFGWSGQEETCVWTIGPGSGLRLPHVAEVSALVLDIDFSICVIEPLAHAAIIRVEANGQMVAAACVKGRTRLRCMIPAALIAASEPLELRFEHPCFLRPDFIDDGTDDRALGLCFYSVCLYSPWLGSAVHGVLPSPPDCAEIEATAPAALEDGDAAERLVYRFGSTEPGHYPPGEGWRFDCEGNAWAGARRCYLDLPAPPRTGRYLARFKIRPIYIRHISPAQRISILLSGAVIGQFRAGVETTLAIPLPPELLEPGSLLHFSFALPNGVPIEDFSDSQSPGFLSFILDAIEIEPLPLRHAGLAVLRADDAAPSIPAAVSERFLDEPVSRLPDAVRAALGVEMADILRHFESLGDNCSFGLAQGKAGGDVLSLLRFANAPLRNLLIALEDEFGDASTTEQIAMRWSPGDPGEFMLFADHYGIRWHTHVFDPDADQAAIFAQQTMRLTYLRRKLYEGLRGGRKIYAVSRAEPKKNPIPIPDADELPYWELAPEPLRLAEILPLFLKLNEFGSNSLLFLTRCANGRRSGTVELLAPGIMHGYVDDFVITPGIETADHASWLRVAVNAWLLHQDHDKSFRNEPAL